ncbi:MAG: alkaline phosphatase family protein [Planctomycetota bacterium]
MTRSVCFALACALFVLASAAAASAQPQKKVLMIGIDGAGGQYVEAANTPSLDALASAGTVRYDAYNEGGLTPNAPSGYGASGVNWSTFVTGASAANHNVVDNSFGGSDFENNPHFFQFVKQADSTLSTISLANWTPINTFITPDEFADVEIGYDVGSASFQDNLLTNDAVSFLTTGRRSGDFVSTPIDPDVMFLHFDQVDSAGHAFSWGSPQHTAAIELVDSHVGSIMGALSTRPGVVSGDEDWLVLVSGDHGATPGSFSHFASQGPDNWEMPFIVSGPSVATGAAMQRPTLRDLAPTALWHLGIDPFLAGMDGTVRGLTVTPPTGVVGDFNNDGAFAGNGAGPAATDDVTTFLANWLKTGDGGVLDRYARGDINLDGVTNLSDWALINDLNPAMGAAIGRALAGVPEPACLGLVALAALTVRLPRQTR